MKKAISLFAGIEGFGLAIHKMGWEVVASVEWEQFPQLVIKKNFPKTEIHGDIKEFVGTKFRGTIDIVCGGFPCQPYSLAGKRQGKDDDRHLWPQMLRVIREVQPTWVIGENVPGLVNWSKGVVFEEVQSDLEAEGYEVQSFILPAAGVGAPHRRDRVWIVAYADHPRASVKMRNNGPGEKDDQRWERWERFSRPEYRQNGSDGTTPHSHGSGFQETRAEQQAARITGSGSQRVTSNPTSNRRLWNRAGFAPEKGQQQGFIQAGQLAGRLEGLCVQGDVTDTPSQQSKRMQSEQREFSQQRQREFRGVNSPMGCGNAADPNSGRLPIEEYGQTQSGWITETSFSNYWQNFPTQSPVCNGDDGIPADLVRYILRTGGDCYTKEEAEKEAKRIISKVRAEGIKAGGNAIVHHVALQIFKSINEFEKSL